MLRSIIHGYHSKINALRSYCLPAPKLNRASSGNKVYIYIYVFLNWVLFRKCYASVLQLELKNRMCSVPFLKHCVTIN